MTAALRVDPQQGLVRGVRAAVLTAPAVGAAALAHGLADGCGSPLAIAVAAGVCWPAAVAVLGARRRTPALLAWLLLAQAVTHLLIERMCTGVPVTHAAALPSSAMTAAHLGAVLVTALLLARADAGLWAADALIRAGSRALRAMRSLPVAAPPVVSRTALVIVAASCRGEQWKAALPALRGPPALAA